MISDKLIKSKAKNEMTYKAGLELAASGAVELVKFELVDPAASRQANAPKYPNVPKPRAAVPRITGPKSGPDGNAEDVPAGDPGAQGDSKQEQNMMFRSTSHVQDGSKSTVTIQADGKGENLSYSCSCSSYWASWGACKHIVSALKQIAPRWEEKTREAFAFSKTEENRAFFNTLEQILSEGMMAREGKISIRIFPTLQCDRERDGQITLKLEFCIGKDKQYLVKDIKQFLNHLDEKKPLEFSKLFIFEPEKMTFDYKSKQLIQLLRSYYEDETRLLQAQDHKIPYYRISMFDGRDFKLGNAGFASFFDIYQDEEIEIRYGTNKAKPIYLSSADFPLLKGNPDNGFGLVVSKYWENHLQIRIKDEIAYPLSADCKYLLYRNTLYKTHSKLAALLKPILDRFIENGNAPLIIAESNFASFYTDIVLPLQQRVGVFVEPFIQDKVEVIPTKSKIKIDQERTTLLVYPEFEYNQADTGKIGVCDRNGERQILQIISKYGFIQEEGKSNTLFSCNKEEQIYHFLTAGIAKIQEFGIVLYSENFKPMKRISSSMLPQISFGLEGDLFEVSFEFSDLSNTDIQECLKAYRMKKHYFRLKNGDFLDLDSKEFAEFSELIEGLGLKERDVKPQPTVLPLFRSLYLDQISETFGTLHISKKDSFLKLIQDIKESEVMEKIIPSDLSGILREYQKQGVLWLDRLHRFHFGGILADDMGLGKTLQVITFLVSEKEKSFMPSLVVAPTSLVYNWEAEVKKFAPQIKTLLIHGSVTERDEKLTHIEEADLIITSYALLRRDISKYQSVRFRACIIDEAQNIKNPKTINSKSVKQVHAQTYFALTGTPIENSLTELWSIFDFLMPGYLFSHPKFQEQFEIPIFKEKDTEAVLRLKRLVSPFILRRMKKDVLKELPEKINSVLYNEMTEEQSKLYASYVLTAKNEFQRLLADSPDLHKNRFEVLSLLTRLRQLCCHPGLFLDNYEGESGKLEQALELIQEALSGQHRILIFSQFTSMLEKVKQKLESQEIEYYYLDGKTSVKDRKNMIDEFQSGKRSLFLLSLKAGGTGLNLTGADMVIHLDPWWNPAVEDQATDRAYRIGQTSRVQVFKLITKDTIEEKIYALQERKNAFVKEMIHFDEESPIFTLNHQELLSLFDLD